MHDGDVLVEGGAGAGLVRADVALVRLLLEVDYKKREENHTNYLGAVFREITEMTLAFPLRF